MINGSELVAEILAYYNVSRVFGNPGTTEKPLIEAVRDHDELDYVFALHEDIAVGMASGYSERMMYHSNNNNTENLPISFVNLHSTPGLVHGLGNVFNSRFENIPMIITTGSDDCLHEQKNPVLSGNRESIISNMVKYSYSISDASEIPYVIRRAIREALTKPFGPVYIDLPYDVQKEETENLEPLTLNLPMKTNECFNEVDDFIDKELVEEIKESENPAIFVGSRVHRKNSEVITKIERFARSIGARIYGETLINTGGYNTSEDLWVRGIKLKESSSEIEGDMHIFLSCNITTPLLEENMKSYDKNTKIVEVSENKEDLLYSEEVDKAYNIPISRFMNSIIQEVNKEEKKLEKAKERAKKEKETFLQELKKHESYNLCREIDKSIGNNFVIYNEGVSSGSVLNHVLDYGHGQFYGLQGGGLGLGLPASIGLKIADKEVGKETKVIAFIGDGSLNYYPQSILSATRHLDKNYDIVVPNNSGYRILQDNIENPEDEYQFTTDVEGVGNSYGLKSVTIENKLGKSISKLLRDERKKLINVKI